MLALDDPDTRRRITVELGAGLLGLVAAGALFVLAGAVGEDAAANVFAAALTLLVGSAWWCARTASVRRRLRESSWERPEVEFRAVRRHRESWQFVRIGDGTSDGAIYVRSCHLRRAYPNGVQSTPLVAGYPDRRIVLAPGPGGPFFPFRPPHGSAEPRLADDVFSDRSGAGPGTMDAAALRAVRLDSSRRGYDREQVEAFLARCAETMAALEDPAVAPPAAPVRPEDVAAAEFGLARNGVDPDQLDALLEQVELSIARS